MFATSMISWFAKNLRPNHFSAINQILTYLVDSQNRDITFGKKLELCLIRYFDSDWARDHTDKKLILWFVFTLNKGSIYYNSKKQAVIALFFTKTEYMAFSLAV